MAIGCMMAIGGVMRKVNVVSIVNVRRKGLELLVAGLR